jgi:protein-disulfide isomerase
MHDLVYTHQKEWSVMPDPESEFLAFAAQLGLDANKFMRSVKSTDVDRRILEDIQRGSNLKVSGTPSFFINGRSVDPLPSGVDEFAKIVDDALQSQNQATK